MKRKVRPGLALLGVALFLTACARPAYPVVRLQVSPQPPLISISPQNRATLRIAIAAILSPRTTYHVYENLAAYLEKRLGEPVEVTQRATYAETNELIRTRQVDLGFVCTGAYIQGRQEFGMELLAVPEINGERTYRSYIIVPADSPARRWEDLRGKVFAFTDPLSLSGYLSPLYLLRSAGETPDRFFARTLFTYSHENSIRAVGERWVDGAAVDSLVYEAMAQENPFYREHIRILWQSTPYGAPPVVVHPDLDPARKAQLQQVLLEMDRDPEGRATLALLGVNRFVLPDDRLYDSAREVVLAVGGKP
jgi:phosphonate transport system substrate-binding protein